MFQSSLHQTLRRILLPFYRWKAEASQKSHKLSASLFLPFLFPPEGALFATYLSSLANLSLKQKVNIMVPELPTCCWNCYRKLHHVEYIARRWPQESPFQDLSIQRKFWSVLSDAQAVLLGMGHNKDTTCAAGKPSDLWQLECPQGRRTVHYVLFWNQLTCTCVSFVLKYVQTSNNKPICLNTSSLEEKEINVPSEGWILFKDIDRNAIQTKYAGCSF